MLERQPIVFKAKQDGSAMVVCPACKLRRRFDVAKLRGKSDQVPVTCTCGEKFISRFMFDEAPTEAPPAERPQPFSPKPIVSADSRHVFFPDASGHVSIRCPHCGFSRVVPAEKFKSVTTNFHVTCKCGHGFRAQIQGIRASSGKDIPKEHGGGEDPVQAAWNDAVVRESDSTGSGIMRTLYPASDGQVTFVCPICGHERTLTQQEREKYPTRFDLDCKCSERYQCLVEYRKHYRKKVHLHGSYSQEESRNRGETQIKDLSLKGVGFVTATPHHLKLGDVVRVRFRLDNQQQTEIHRPVEIRFIKGRFIGAQFLDTLSYEKDIGFYLLN